MGESLGGPGKFTPSGNGVITKPLLLVQRSVPGQSGAGVGDERTAMGSSRGNDHQRPTRAAASSSGPQPHWWLRLLAGALSAVGALGAGQLVAVVLAPESSPLVAVGAVLIDAAPTPAKTAAVRLLGVADKPVLLAAIAFVLVVVGGVLGIIGWRRRRLALAGVAVLGLLGTGAVLLRGAAPVQLVAPVVTLVVGVGALAAFTRRSSGGSAPPATATATGTGAPAPVPASAEPNAVGQVAELRRPSRRALFGGAGLAGLATLGAASGSVVTPRRRVDTALPTADPPAEPIPAGAQVPGAVPFVTANDEFYRVDISLITPRVDQSDWELRIDGEVDDPITLSYAELLSLPVIERTITMACVSNEVGGPYVSTARWLGVPFRAIVDLVGVRAGVDQCFSHSLDGGYTCSTPYGPLVDGRDAMVAVGMNGVPLPDKNGFPARMLVPGLFGFVSGTKWLSRLEFTTYAEKSAYWTDRDWAVDAPVLTQSRIDSPASLGELDPAAPVIAGTAWATHRGISRVEVRIDDGPWQPAVLGASAGVDVWRQWSLRYQGPPGRHTAQVRATDGAGQVQPQDRTAVFPSGATGWHTIQFSVGSPDGARNRNEPRKKSGELANPMAGAHRTISRSRHRPTRCRAHAAGVREPEQ